MLRLSDPIVRRFLASAVVFYGFFGGGAVYLWWGVCREIAAPDPEWFWLLVALVGAVGSSYMVIAASRAQLKPEVRQALGRTGSRGQMSAAAGQYFRPKRFPRR